MLESRSFFRKSLEIFDTPVAGVHASYYSWFEFEFLCQTMQSRRQRTLVKAVLWMVAFE